jgi:hypothetical protein
MKVFIWHRIDQCSDNYHTEGGVVVFAADEARARELANAREGCEIKPKEVPSEVRECDGDDERVFIMPDAGCC